MIRYFCSVLALGVCSWAGLAQAQTGENTAVPGASSAFVSIHTGAKALDLQVTPLGSNGVVAECHQYCEFWVLPGRYTVYAKDPTTGKERELSLRVNGSSRYVLEQGDDTARYTGLTLGIAGPVAIFTGILLTMPVVLASMCEGPNCVTDSERRTAAIGLGVMVAGAVATPIGWTLFSHNRTGLRRLADTPYTATDSGPSVRVGVVGLAQGGLGLGGVAVF